MLKIKDLFDAEKGFFSTLYYKHTEIYNKLFPDVEYTTLNLNFISLCGERYISPNVSMFTRDTIVNYYQLTEMILNNYLNSWLRVRLALFAEYDPIKPVKVSITTDKELQSDRNTNNENSENSYLYPFNNNSDEINQGKNQATSVNIVANVEKSTQTVIREGITNAKPAELINAEIRTRKITFISLVLNDLKDFCTLQIY